MDYRNATSVVHIFFNRAPLSILLVALLAFSTFSRAQDEGARREYVPRSQEQSSMIAREFGRRAQSGEYQPIVPDAVYYRIIFKEIISGASTGDGLPVSMSDWSVIVNLPSHRDERFESVSYAELESLCASIFANASDLSDERIIGFAIEYDSSRKHSEERLSKHYETVLSQLSRSTKELVASRRAALINANSIGYSRFDMTSYAYDDPTRALDRMLGGCEAVATYKAAHAPRAQKLSEETTISIPITRR